MPPGCAEPALTHAGKDAAYKTPYPTKTTTTQQNHHNSKRVTFFNAPQHTSPPPATTHSTGTTSQQQQPLITRTKNNTRSCCPGRSAYSKSTPSTSHNRRYPAPTQNPHKPHQTPGRSSGRYQTRTLRLRAAIRRLSNISRTPGRFALDLLLSPTHTRHTLHDRRKNMGHARQPMG